MLGFVLACLLTATQDAQRLETVTTEHAFETHDGYALAGRLTLPAGEGPHPVVIYVQTAEGMTIDMRRPLGGGRTFDYFDLYAEHFPRLGVGFFRYEGRGITSGDVPPRYERIDRAAYDTSTLDNKVRDLLAALGVTRGLEGVDPDRVFLMGASEGTLLAADAASRAPDEVAGLVLYGAMSGTLRDLFRFIMTDGGFLTYRGYFDSDQDGVITRAEFEADPLGYGKAVFRGAGFEIFDQDEDGVFTAADMSRLTRMYLDAIDEENYAVLDAWAKNSAGVSTPAGWFQDHFEYEPIWTFLSQLELPVGVFHGELDGAAPVAGVRQLEQQASAAGKTGMEFHYFADADHTLGIGTYFATGELPAGHAAIFQFVEWTARN